MVPGLRVFWLPSLAPWFSVLLVDSRFVRDPRSRTRGRSVPACPIFLAAFVLGLAEGRVAAVACVAAEDDDVPRIYSVSCSRAAVMVQVSRAPGRRSGAGLLPMRWPVPSSRRGPFVSRWRPNLSWIVFRTCSLISLYRLVATLSVLRAINVSAVVSPP